MTAQHATRHDSRCENLPGGSYHDRTIGRPIPCHCVARRTATSTGRRAARAAKPDNHTCVRGPACAQMEHYRNCPHTSSDDPRGHCQPCDHPSCTAIVFGWECRGCERDNEATSEISYIDYDGRRALA